ncbi:hypothetical protein CAPTEDRAFT_170613 [Capitella teleta]|uniref:J domain-containing protein n=1 Tax=Capitella teleta TaxID=283909 RepID=R7UFF3_CAPTE|nr:hypothetical protein CAPTEDRAFT_170613 [Capitella teleta]|eukprot:ELU01987.1 hypothetical protein CAPTEDRAFT_170613 [Capitella teleta]
MNHTLDLEIMLKRFLPNWRRGLHTSCPTLGHQLKNNLPDCYSLLRVTEDSSTEEVRESYLRLAKEYHPDSGSTVADARKFSQVDEAYRSILNHRQNSAKTQQGQATEAPNDNHFQHTAPQHRQYLSYESVGFGTPSQRERQYQQFRTQRAVENLYEYRTGKIANEHESLLMTKDKKEARKNTVRNAIERLVEDLIAESMAKGEFENLPGSGKPLPHDSYNPMVDSTTHNLNKMLIQNGYAPEWITLTKEVNLQLEDARKVLLEERIRLGKEPLSATAQVVWSKKVNDFENKMQEVNKNINKLNMLTPTIQQQMIPFSEKCIRRNVNTVLETYRVKAERGDFEAQSRAEPTTHHYYAPKAEDKLKITDVFKEIAALFNNKIS